MPRSPAHTRIDVLTDIYRAYRNSWFASKRPDVVATPGTARPLVLVPPNAAGAILLLRDYCSLFLTDAERQRVDTAFAESTAV